MKIEISVKEQELLKDFLRNNKIDGLQQFLDRLDEVYSKRTKVHNDEDIFNVGDIVDVIKYRNSKNLLVIGKNKKDKKGKIYYEVLPEYIWSVIDEYDGDYWYVDKLRPHSLQKVKEIDKVELKKIQKAYKKSLQRR
jgi:hypothetical protein